MEGFRSFGQMHFAGVDLGDERRNRRLPQLADELARHPAGTLPQKFSRPADLEAFYRLCDADDVTHAAVLAPHRRRVLHNLQTTRKFLLVVHDSTEFDFSKRKSLQRLGQIGGGNGRGYIAHHSLVVDPHGGSVLGLANQILHARPKVPRSEGVAAKRNRESRESRLWLQAAADLPARSQVVDVCDRGADTFEFLEHEVRSGRTFVIRAARDRPILPTHDRSDAQSTSLFEFVRGLAPLTTGETQVRLTADQRLPSTTALPTLRTVQLQLSAAPLRVLPPRKRRGVHGDQPLALWVVRIWEPNPPEGCEGLEWLLLTNHPCEAPRELRRVQAWYEWRWVIEEFHKGQKTGCGLEDLQLRDESRLEPALAILSIVALLLLQLRDAARSPAAERRRAAELIPAEAIEVLSLWRDGAPHPDWTIHDYFSALAQLGGYRRRKNCPPGWQVLWRGHMKLQILIEGMRLCDKRPATRPPKCAKR
jgi:hypothetical protein